MYAAFQEYYPEEVGPDTMVKVIRFEFMPELASDEDLDDEEPKEDLTDED